MPPITRIGDNGTGHGCYPARPSIGGSPNVYVNSIPVVRQGDPYDTHCCGSSCHGGNLASGSSIVYVNGLQLGRIGDPISCGSSVAVGSPNTYAGP